MKLSETIADWFNIRPEECRTLVGSIFGAFFMVGFLIMGRSLYDAIYLTTYPVETLPYIKTAVAILSLPTVAFFVHLVSRYKPKNVYSSLLLVIALGAIILWPLLERIRPAVIIFYLWIALGTLIVTSGFWIVITEHFHIRGAKRLYGFITAGGTLGAMVAGTSLRHIPESVEMPILASLLIFIILLMRFALPQKVITPKKDEDPPESKTSLREGFSFVWTNKHLRTLGAIVAVATMASAILDYQFKDLVRSTLETKQELKGFFGSFYGWTAAVSLFLQLVVASRLMASFGIAVALSVLPIVLLLGSFAILVAPTLLFATLARGGDNSLRKSLHRSAIEVLYVPLPSHLRRKTKTFIDSVLDAIAEGVGNGLVFLSITLLALPSRVLSIPVLFLAGVFLWLNRKMNKEYYETLVSALTKQKRKIKDLVSETRFDGRDLLSATLTKLNLPEILKDRGLITPKDEESIKEEIPPKTSSTPKEKTTLSMITSNRMDTVTRALEEKTDWDQTHVPTLVQLLARDSLSAKVSEILSSCGLVAVPEMISAFKDEQIDFATRRRLPRILCDVGGPEVDEALIQGLNDRRFEIRYRSAIALTRRRRNHLPKATGNWKSDVWAAIDSEVSRDKAVWEMQRLLDEQENENDGLVTRKVEKRGALSLEHTFRMLALVVDPEPTRMAFQGILVNDEKLKVFALEFLEHVLPPEIRGKLWPFIGDLSERQRRRVIREVDDVVSDLLQTGVTLFDSKEARIALEKLRQNKPSKE